MCAEENVAKAKALETSMKWNFNMYIQQIILKPAKDGFRFVQCNPDFNGAKVNLHNGGALSLGTNRNVSGVSNSS